MVKKEWKPWNTWLLIALAILLVLLIWNTIGYLVLRDAVDFEKNNKMIYETDAKYYIDVGDNGPDPNIRIEYTDEAETLMKLLKSEVKYKSMEVASWGGGLSGLVFYEEYKHFDIRYYLFYDNGDEEKYCFYNISTQEGCSYIEKIYALVSVRVYFEQDDDLPNFLQELLG